jgi:hypothetical protein
MNTETPKRKLQK